jgi:hypothetical protein
MTPFTSNGHAPESTRPDPGDQARCPMERLGDRIMDAPQPKWLKRYASRDKCGLLWVEFSGHISSPDQIEDLINFLARVKG